jgi:hypothetical protein
MKRAPYKRICLTIDNYDLELDAVQLAQLNRWLEGIFDRIDKKHHARGRGQLAEIFKQRGEVYAGVSGGNLTFEITPTGLGTVFKVRESVTGEAIDLSDYDTW